VAAKNSNLDTLNSLDSTLRPQEVNFVVFHKNAGAFCRPGRLLGRTPPVIVIGS